jgi:tRNA (Thr-GGU) A37 N-methylase
MMEIRPIAHIRTAFAEKFGVPRQSGLAKQLRGRIVFEKEFRNPDALRGLEGFSHLWIIWEFSANRKVCSQKSTEGMLAQPISEETIGKCNWQPTVRPPRLGGNTQMGVFATRSPFRPNPLGLSCVKIAGIELNTPEGPVVEVAGADLMDGTPVYDIKPYVTYSDSIPEAYGGFSEKVKDYRLDVVIPEDELKRVPECQQKLLYEILEQDPRPSYQEDLQRVYGMEYAGMEIKFTAAEGVLTVKSIEIL